MITSEEATTLTANIIQDLSGILGILNIPETQKLLDLLDNPNKFLTPNVLLMLCWDYLKMLSVVINAGEEKYQLESMLTRISSLREDITLALHERLESCQ